MSNLKTILTITTAAALFAGTACAQDETPLLDTAPDTLASDFAAADLDQDGALNADEFVTFSVMRAEAGEADYKDLVLGGEYDTKFSSHDADASGSLSADELGSHSMDSSDYGTTEPETDDELIEPDLN